MTPTPDWLVQIERLLNDATPFGEAYCRGHGLQTEWEIHNKTGGVCFRSTSYAGMKNDAKFIAASPDNQRKLISALKVALEALEKVIRVDGHEMLYPRGPSISKEARSEIQKIGELK